MTRTITRHRGTVTLALMLLALLLLTAACHDIFPPALPIAA
jgi:hypothetical protein